MNLEQTLDKLLIAQRGWSLRLPKDEPIVLMLTGGLDSSLLAEVCLRELHAQVYPLYIRRGAKAEQYEERAAIDVVAYLKKKYDNMHELYTIDAEIPPSKLKKQFDETYVKRMGHPMRNVIAELYAVQYAVMLSQTGTKVRTVAIGSINEDVSPDGHPASFLASTVATCVSMDDWSWQITAPYLLDGLLADTVKIHKEDIVAWGKRQGFPFHLTRSCISGSVRPCDACSACLRRNTLHLEEQH